MPHHFDRFQVLIVDRLEFSGKTLVCHLHTLVIGASHVTSIEAAEAYLSEHPSPDLVVVDESIVLSEPDAAHRLRTFYSGRLALMPLRRDVKKPARYGCDVELLMDHIPDELRELKAKNKQEPAHV